MLQDYINASAEKLLLQIYAMPDMKIAIAEMEAMGDEAHLTVHKLCEDKLIEAGGFDCTTSSGDVPVLDIHPTVYQLTAKGRVQARCLMQEAAKAEAAQKQLNRHKHWQGLKQGWLAFWALVKVLIPFLHCL